MSKIIPDNFTQLLEFYFSDKKCYVQHDELKSEFYRTNAGVPQGSTSDDVLYLIYATDILSDNNITITNAR